VTATRVTAVDRLRRGTEQLSDRGDAGAASSTARHAEDASDERPASAAAHERARDEERRGRDTQQRRQHDDATHP